MSYQRNLKKIPYYSTVPIICTNKSFRFGANLVPRVFLRHTLITKPNEHPGTLRSHLPKKWANVEAYGFHRWLGNAKGRKMAIALALILHKMNGEIENKHFGDLIRTFLQVFKQ